MNIDWTSKWVSSLLWIRSVELVLSWSMSEYIVAHKCQCLQKAHNTKTFPKVHNIFPPDLTPQSISPRNAHDRTFPPKLTKFSPQIAKFWGKTIVDFRESFCVVSHNTTIFPRYHNTETHVTKLFPKTRKISPLGENYCVVGFPGKFLCCESQHNNFHRNLILRITTVLFVFTLCKNKDIK